MPHKRTVKHNRPDPYQGIPSYMKGWIQGGCAKGSYVPLTTVMMQLCNDSFPEAVILGQILYWYGEGKDGDSRIRVFRSGYWWLSKKHSDWYHEVRVKETTAKRAIANLKKKGLIHVEYHRFNGLKQCYIRPLWENLEVKLQIAHKEDDAVRSKWLNRSGQNDPTEEVKMTRPLTETTYRDYPTKNTDQEITRFVSESATCAEKKENSVYRYQREEEDLFSPTQQISDSLAIAPNNSYQVTNPTSKDKVSCGFSLEKEKSAPIPLSEALNEEYYLGYNKIPCDGPHKAVGALTAQTMQWLIFHNSDLFTVLQGHNGELYVSSDHHGILDERSAIATNKLKKLFQLADINTPRGEEMNLHPGWYNEEIKKWFGFFTKALRNTTLPADFSVGNYLFGLGEITAEPMSEDDYEELSAF